MAPSHCLLFPIILYYLLYFSSWFLPTTIMCIILVAMFICSWFVSLTEIMNKMLYEGKNLIWFIDDVAQNTSSKYLLKLLIESPSLISLYKYIHSKWAVFFFLHNFLFLLFVLIQTATNPGMLCIHFHGLMEFVSQKTLPFKGCYKEKPATSQWNLHKTYLEL